MKKYIFLMLFVFTGMRGWPQYNRIILPLKDKLSHSKEDTGKVNLLLKIGNLYMFGNEIANHMDSANLYHSRALQLSVALREPNLQHKILKQIALFFSLSHDYERARETYLRVIAWYHQTGQFAKEAVVWEELAERYGHFHDSQYLDETISYYEKARSLYLQKNQPIEAAGVLANIADKRIYFKQFDTAEKELHQVLDQYKAAGYKKLQPVYQYLYRLHRNKGNYYRAMAFLMESIRNMSVDGDSLQEATYYILAAQCNMAVKKYDEANEWIRKASAIRKSDNNLKCLLAQNLLALNRTDEAGLILNNLQKQTRAELYGNEFDLNRTLALYYNKKNNYEQAVSYYLKSLAISERIAYVEYDENIRHIECNNGIAAAYLEMNQPAKAEKYLKSTALIFKNAKTALDPALLADYYGYLYEYDVATGNHAAAVKNLERRVQIQDSLFTADKDKQLAELNIQYETTQKEQSIKDLQSQRVAQQAQTDKANQQRNITIGGVFIMIVVSFLFYRNYQQKKKANNIISNQNGQLQHLLSEKEWLLKEVHHRVKNNLQTIISLLQSQAIYLHDDALEANQISKNRIYAMSLIHQQLYKTEDMKSIDMAVFLPELLDNLAESFGTERKILFHRTISPIKLGISQAIPIALIINETVTNAIKYAFPNERPGNIKISMHQSADTITLVIADDGTGIDTAILEKETNSLGMKLLKGLTEDIGGEITIANDNGTTITISFNPDPLNEFRSFSGNN